MKRATLAGDSQRQTSRGRVYYHTTQQVSYSPGIGLVKLRREGFISMRGPKNGGVICTRQVLWPGGKLLVNADASDGEFSVRVTDAKRKVVPGFDYDDCVTFSGNGVAHEVAWKDKSIDSQAGQVVRFEFFLKDADLYTFRASGQTGQRPTISRNESE